MEYLILGLIIVGVLAISHWLCYQYGWMDGYLDKAEADRQRGIK